MASNFFNQIVEKIEKKLGLNPYSTSLFNWNAALKQRMAVCHLISYEDYWKLLQLSSQEVQKLIELMVNPETWFFRDKKAFNFLMLLAQKQKNSSFFKALSLACSTGEEPYSIAMTLFDAGLAPHTFKVDALDINQQSLITAQTGLYRRNSFRGTDLSYREHYFQATTTGYHIKDQIKQHVHFYYGNILDKKIPCEAQFYQVIFCRNLLIYLNAEARTYCLNRIKTLLTSQGVLIVGAAETQIARRAGFVPVHFPHAYAFRLKQESTQEREEKSLKSMTQLPVSVVSPESKLLASETELQRLSWKVEEPKKKLFQEAMTLADAGSFEESIELCVKWIENYGASPEVYYLLGLVHQAVGKEDKAEEYFHKAIYLQPSHYEALVCLTLLYEKRGERDKAELFRRRAQKNL